MRYHVISALAADAFKNAVNEIAIVRGGPRQDEPHLLAAGGAKWLYGNMRRNRIGIACVGHVALRCRTGRSAGASLSHQRLTQGRSR